MFSGLPGFTSWKPMENSRTTALEIEDGKIAVIYVVRSPDELRHLQ
jgi:RNA polymerase sigma-70 factor (ECF subfamily)